MSDKETDFLDDIPETADAAPATPDPEDVVEEKGVAVAEVTPTPAVEKDDRVPLAALMAERDKRQKERDERVQLQRELDQLRQAKQQEQAPTFYEGPEQYVTQAIQAANSQAEQRLYSVLDAEARESFPDYDEVMDELTQRVQQNPALRQEIFSSPNPAKAAYRLGKKLREVEAMQDPESYRQRLKDEIRAELEAETKSKEEARRATADAIPPDLASARNATADTAHKAGTVFQDIF